MRGWNTLSSAQEFQGLLLALHYGVIPRGLGGPLEYQGLSAGLLHASKHLIQLAISLAHLDFNSNKTI